MKYTFIIIALFLIVSSFHSCKVNLTITEDEYKRDSTIMSFQEYSIMNEQVEPLFDRVILNAYEVDKNKYPLNCFKPYAILFMHVDGEQNKINISWNYEFSENEYFNFGMKGVIKYRGFNFFIYKKSDQEMISTYFNNSVKKTEVSKYRCLDNNSEWVPPRQKEYTFLEQEGGFILLEYIDKEKSLDPQKLKD